MNKLLIRTQKYQVIEDHKICATCKKVKHKREFGRTSSLGYRKDCKECNKAYAKKRYYKLKAEKVTETNKKD